MNQGSPSVVVIDVRDGVEEELSGKGYPVNVEQIQGRLRKWTLRVSGRLIPFPVEVSLVLVADSEMRELNGQWRGLFRVTDVLSFPQMSIEDLTINAHEDEADSSQPPTLLGDVVIAPAVVYRRAGSAEVFWEDLGRVLIHGLLHLTGRDHKKAGDRLKMRAEEEELGRLLDLILTRK